MYKKNHSTNCKLNTSVQKNYKKYKQNEPNFDITILVTLQITFHNCSTTISE